MKHLLLWLLLLAGALANAQTPASRQAPDWEGIEPLPGYNVAAATATTTGDVYFVGNRPRYSKSDGDPERALLPPGSDAYVAKWSAATHQLAWWVPIQHSQDDYVTGLAVQGDTLYVAGSQGLRHSLETTGTRSVFITRLLDHGTSASVCWTQQLRVANAATEVRFLALAGSSLYLAGTSQTALNSRSTQTGKRVPPDSSFLAKVTVHASTGTINWRHTWPADLHYSDLAGLVAQGGKVYLATNTWQEQTSYIETKATRQLGTLPHGANHRLHLTQFSDQGAAWHLDWTRTEAGVATAFTVADSVLYLLGREDADRAFEAPHSPTTAPAASGDMFLAKLPLTRPTAPPRWALRLPGTGHSPVNRLKAVAVRGRQVYVAGTFDRDQLSLGDLVVGSANPNFLLAGKLFVAQLTDAGATAHFDWTQRQNQDTSTPDLCAFDLVGTRLFVLGHFSGFSDRPVLLGTQQFTLPPYADTLLESWLPVGN